WRLILLTWYSTTAPIHDYAHLATDTMRHSDAYVQRLRCAGHVLEPGLEADRSAPDRVIFEQVLGERGDAWVQIRDPLGDRVPFGLLGRRDALVVVGLADDAELGDVDRQVRRQGAGSCGAGERGAELGEVGDADRFPVARPAQRAGGVRVRMHAPADGRERPAGAGSTPARAEAERFAQEPQRRHVVAGVAGDRRAHPVFAFG